MTDKQLTTDLTLKESREFILNNLLKAVKGEMFDALLVQAAIGDLQNYYAQEKGRPHDSSRR